MRFHAVDHAVNAVDPSIALDLRPLAGALGAELVGVDLAALAERPDPAVVADLTRALDRHLVLVVRDQDLDPARLLAVTRLLGEPGEGPFVRSLPDHPGVVRVVKEADEAVPVVFGGAWHSDWSFLERPPAYTCLYAVDVPDHGGDTCFANLYLATEWLSEGLRSVLGGLEGVHSPRVGYGPDAGHNALLENMDISWGEDGLVERRHPLLRRHPGTGREVLFVNPVYTVGIEGWRQEEARALLDLITEVVTAEVHRVRVRWHPGTLVVWDDRCTWHLPLNDYHGARREMLRTTVAGEVPVPARRPPVATEA